MTVTKVQAARSCCGRREETEVSSTFRQGEIALSLPLQVIRPPQCVRVPGFGKAAGPW